MIKTYYQGRLGNKMLHSVGASILAKKFNYTISHQEIEDFRLLNPIFFSGKIINKNFKKIKDTENPTEGLSLKELCLMEEINFGLDLQETSFQDKFFVTQYKTEILSSFNLNYNFQNENNLFIHVRLGDAAHLNHGYEYYKKCIMSTSFTNGYISSDSINHEIVQKLKNEFNLIEYQNDSIQTIDFAKNFNKLILSHGTFSWWMGFFSKGKEIYIPENKPNWCGDIFVFDNWIKK